MALLRLICFPYAGGSARAFRRLAGDLQGRIDVCPVELPGRGKRYGERCVDDWRELDARLVAELAPLLRQPYALLGYSLGALVALRAAHAIAAHDPAVPRPAALVACALHAPATLAPSQLLHKMEDRAMFEALRDLGGIPDEFLASPELVALSAPAMRADLRLFETYAPRERPLRGTPVHAYYGRGDDEAAADIAGWRDETDGPFRSRAFDGGHMFIDEDPHALAEALAADLLAAVPAIDAMETP